MGKSFEIRISRELVREFFTDGYPAKGRLVRFEGCPPPGVELVDAGFSAERENLVLVFSADKVVHHIPEVITPVVHTEDDPSREMRRAFERIFEEARRRGMSTGPVFCAADFATHPDVIADLFEATPEEGHDPDQP